MTLSLYTIADDYMAALRTLESLLADGTLTQEVVSDTLEGLSGDLEAKAINVVAFAKNIAAESAAIKAAIQPMQARMKALDAKEEWLLKYVKAQMERTGVTEIKTPYYVIKVRNNPGSVVIDNEADIPAEFWRVIPEERTPDKAAIKAFLFASEKNKSEGHAVDACSYAHLEKGTRLEIK